MIYILLSILILIPLFGHFALKNRLTNQREKLKISTDKVDNLIYEMVNSSMTAAQFMEKLDAILKSEKTKELQKSRRDKLNKIFKNDHLQK